MWYGLRAMPKIETDAALDSGGPVELMSYQVTESPPHGGVHVVHGAVRHESDVADKSLVGIDQQSLITVTGTWMEENDMSRTRSYRMHSSH